MWCCSIAVRISLEIFGTVEVVFAGHTTTQGSKCATSSVACVHAVGTMGRAWEPAC